MSFYGKENVLSSELLKQRNEKAFNRFLDDRINNSTSMSQPIKSNFGINSLNKVNTNNLLTTKNEDGSITTKELCNIPFPFVQSETTLYPDGSKIFTSFYPSNERIPSKTIEISAQSTIKKTTTFDRNGKEKMLERILQNADGSGVEETIDFKFERKQVRKFNNNNVSQSIENYIKEKLAFKIECDLDGNILKETSYYAFAPGNVLQKEVVYNNTEFSYTTKEYNMFGQLSSVHKTFTQKKKLSA